MDRLFSGFGMGRWSPFGSAVPEWTPAIDTCQRGNEFAMANFRNGGHRRGTRRRRRTVLCR